MFASADLQKSNIKPYKYNRVHFLAVRITKIIHHCVNHSEEVILSQSVKFVKKFFLNTHLQTIDLCDRDKALA